MLTSLGALLPIAAEYARREGMHGLKWAAWLAIPLALAFVFTVSIQRTGSASDIDEASRQQIAAAVAIAEKEQGEAEKQLVVDQLMVASNCDIIGPKCKAAMDAKAATEAKLAGARALLQKAGRRGRGQHGQATDCLAPVPDQGAGAALSAHAAAHGARLLRLIQELICSRHFLTSGEVIDETAGVHCAC